MVDEGGTGWVGDDGATTVKTCHDWGSATGLGIRNVGMQISVEGPGWAGLGLPPDRHYGVATPLEGEDAPFMHPL